MDVLNRLLPRSHTKNGTAGFKRLKQQQNGGTADDLSSAFVGLCLSNGLSAQCDGPSAGLNSHSLSASTDQLALIPATDSPKVELGLQIRGKEKEGKRLKKGDKGGTKPNPADKGVLTKLPSVDAVDEERKSRGGFLLALLPGKRGEKGSKGKAQQPIMPLGMSASEPHLAQMFNQPPAESGEEEDWEGEGDRRRLYQQRQPTDCGHNALQNQRTKLTQPVAGALQMVRCKFPGRFGAVPNSNSSTAAASGCSSAASSLSSSRSSQISIHRSATIPNGFPMAIVNNNVDNKSAGAGEQQKGKPANQQQQNANGISGKLRKPAKIMDIVSRNGRSGGGSGRLATQSKKPVDAQRLLLFEEGAE